MANPQKAKGTAWETAIVTYLRSLGFTDARREVQRGRADVGDIGGFVLWAMEAKAYKAINFSTLRDFVKQANREADHAEKPYGIVVLKNPNHSTADAFVIMDLRTWTAVEAKMKETREGQ